MDNNNYIVSYNGVHHHPTDAALAAAAATTTRHHQADVRAADGNNDDYDNSKKQQRHCKSPSSGTTSNILAGVVANLPNLASLSISPSNSFDHHHQQQQQHQQHRHQHNTTSAAPSSFSSYFDDRSNNNNHNNNLHNKMPVSIPPPPPSFTTRTFQERFFNNNNNNNVNLPPPFVIQVTAIASLGGVLFGYDMGVIAGALPQLTTTFDLSPQQEELVVSILYVGGGLGAAVGGSLCDYVGRKVSILLTDLTFVIGAGILFTSTSLTTICVGRIIVGFAVAVSGIADVSYLHEIAPTQWRGSIVSVNEACISLGFLLAFVVGSIFTTTTTTTTNNMDDNVLEEDSPPPRGWRYMFGLGGVMALIQLVGMWNMPESPIWLKDKGRHDQAKAALRRIYGGDPIPSSDDNDNIDDNNNEDHHHHHQSDDERDEEEDDAAIQIKANYESLSSNYPAAAEGDRRTITKLMPTSSPSSSGGAVVVPPSYHYHHRTNPLLQSQFLMMCLHKLQRGWNQLKRVVLDKYRRQVWIAIFLSVTQQFCGQTSVLNYAPTILKAVVQQDADTNGNGDDDEEGELSGWATLSIGMVKFIATIIVIWKIEHVGRRTLLLMGMGTIAFGLLLVAIAFSSTSPYAKEQHADENGVVVQRGSGMAFALPGVLLVVSGYSMSFGPLTWLITSELFPTDIRGRALGTSTIVTYLCAAMVTYSFLTAQSLLGTTAVFMIYMLITLVGMVFACLAIPDTGGKTQEEIDADLSNMPWWRRFSGSEPTMRRRRVSSSSRLSTSSSMDDPRAVNFTTTALNGVGRRVEAELT